MVTKPATELVIVGGTPALDLANTFDGPRDAPITGDFLRDYDELVAWAVHAGVIDAAVAARLAAGGGDGARAARVFARVADLRAAIDAAFRAIANGGRPPDAALAAILTAEADALAHGRLARVAGGFELTWDGAEPERVLWPLAHDAGELLRHGQLERIKVCVECRWMFLDASRNHSRRWCSMNECGGRLKMQRYRARRATAGR